MGILHTQGMAKPTKAEYADAASAVAEYKASGASNRFRADNGNVAIWLIALTLADRMDIAPASLASRRDWVRDGGSAVTADWTHWSRASLALIRSASDGLCRRWVCGPASRSGWIGCVSLMATRTASGWSARLSQPQP